jgi:hypothetical protein
MPGVMVRFNAKQIDDIRSVIASLDGLQSELGAAAKRKSTEPVTNFQLRLINLVLAKANALLGANKPIGDFEKFEPDDIPTVSDVSMVVAQYVESFEKIRCENIEKMFGNWVWKGTNIATVAPRARK